MAAPVQVNETSAAAAATTVAIAQGSNPTIGNTNVVWARGPGGATVTGVADSLGHTYTPRGSVIEAGTTQVLYQFTAPITSTGANTVTATYGASTGNRGIVAAEMAGTYDASNTGTDTGNNPTTAVAATNTAQPATVVMLCNDVQGGTPAVGTGFTDAGTGWATLGLNYRLQWKDVSTVGSQSGDFGNAGFDRTNTGLVIVLGAVQPQITQQPVTQYVMDGGTVTFTVAGVFTGSPSYQWKKNGSNVGTNSASYSLTSAMAENGSQFTVTVTDSNGAVTSRVAYLYVLRVQVTAQALPAGQSTIFDYSPGGWFGLQAGTTPAGMFDSSMILLAGAGGGLNGQTDESVALTDSQNANAVFGVARAESVALTDAQTVNAVYPVAQAESVALTDSQSATGTYAGTRAESVALTDSQAATGTYAVATAESVAITDSQDATITGGGGLTGQTDESVALTDSQVAQADFAAARTESVALTDSQTSALVTSVAQAESVALTDAQTATSTFVGAAAESVALTDSQAAIAVFVAAQAESVALTDSQNSAAVFLVARAESVALSDLQDATVIAAGTNQVDESFGLSDSQNATTETSTVVVNTPGNIRPLARQWRGETPEEKKKRWALIEAEPIEPEPVKPDPRPLKIATLEVQVATLKAEAAKYEAIAQRQREALKAASDLEKLTAMYAELERQANAAQAQAQAQIEAMNQAIEEQDVIYVMSVLFAD